MQNHSLKNWFNTPEQNQDASNIRSIELRIRKESMFSLKLSRIKQPSRPIELQSILLNASLPANNSILSHQQLLFWRKLYELYDLE
jgi:hypothetical protein